MPDSFFLRTSLSLIPLSYKHRPRGLSGGKEVILVESKWKKDTGGCAPGGFSLSSPPLRAQASTVSHHPHCSGSPTLDGREDETPDGLEPACYGGQGAQLLEEGQPPAPRSWWLFHKQLTRPAWTSQKLYLHRGGNTRGWDHVRPLMTKAQPLMSRVTGRDLWRRRAHLLVCHVLMDPCG